MSVRGPRRAPLQVGDRSPTNNSGERLLVLSVVYQALADLTNPEEHEDAVEFLTKSLWEIEDEGLAFRDLAPEMFTESNRATLMARIEAIMAEPKTAPVLTSDDGVMSYDEVAVYLTK